ncbi:MAG: CTP synthase [Candidatus Odinarchaeota archaeon]|nr:CTP synthase [Candidatus Odinarchaeota archaeon]
MVKFIFITGGVMSGLGKGITAASIAKLLQFRGYKIDMMKIDPYFNVDAGTMNPIEHGEVFVTEQVWNFTPVGNSTFRICEIDQDFGTYERFLDQNLHPMNNVTSGQIYLSVILKERVGEYLGKTIQIIPHIVGEIKRRIKNVATYNNPDILIVEVGGTVGDIESMPFLEAIRQFILEIGKENAILIHVTYVPFLKTVGQFKTKPTQHSVRFLQGAGLQPDIIICRAERYIDSESRAKISLFSNVEKRAVISNPDVNIIYEMPLIFEKQGLGDIIVEYLKLERRQSNYKEWKAFIDRIKQLKVKAVIGLVGKYVTIKDSYISINEALKHAGYANNAGIELRFIDSEKIEDDDKMLSEIDNIDGVLLTPGFGKRGVEGMIKAATYAMKIKKPILGICFGAQIMFIAFCRNYLNLRNANSTEIDPETPYPVVDLLPEQKKIVEKGGTMRLGGHKIYIKPNTKLFDAYKEKVIVERFRHRYHIIPEYAKMAEEKGLIVSAVDERNRIINAIELKDFWAVGVQFHPEYKSRPLRPSPIYVAFIKAVLDNRENK